jgi:microcystin-dependent protein
LQTGATNTSVEGSHTHPITVDPTGGGAAHNNMQPSLAITIYIKI